MLYSPKQKVDLNTFKASHSLQIIANNYLKLNLKQEGVWQQCPCCHKNTSFIINQNQTFYCAKTNCDLHSPKAQDIFDLFQWQGYSYTETLRLLNISSSNQSFNTPTNKLSEIFEVCKRDLIKNNLALDYLYTRYKLTKEDLSKPIFEIGYCEELKELGFKTPRLLFPLYDFNGNLVHLHTRALDNSEEPRWLPTKTDRLGESNLQSFGHYLWNGSVHKNTKHLFLTEGISDGLILTKLGLPTISLLSINCPLDSLLSSLNLDSIVILCDNDTQPLSHHDRTPIYKSWNSIIPKLLSYNIKNPTTQIWCLMPPNEVGIKDINDWIQVKNLTQETFLNLVSTKATLLPEFTINNFWNSIKLHPLLINLINSHKINKQYISTFTNKINNEQLFNYLVTLTNANIS